MTVESRTEMGISTELWRARIGCFVQPQKCKVHLRGIKLGSLSLSIRILLFTLLAVHCVETNPGPPKPSRGGDFNARCGEVKDITIDDTVDFIFDENVVYELSFRSK